MNKLFTRIPLVPILLLVLFIGAQYRCAYGYPVKIYNSKDSIDIGVSVEYYEDKAANLTLKDVIKLDNENKFRTTQKLPLNFGYSPYTYWLSFSVFGDTESESGWVLDVPYAPLDYVTLYAPNGRGDYVMIKSGDKIPFSDKQIVYRNPVFVLGNKLIPYQQYYLRVSSSGAINLPLFLWSGTGFLEYINKFQTGMGLYFGLMFALVLYNLFLYFSVRDKDFLLCSFVIVSYMLVQGTYSGLAGEFLWPGYIWWANNSLVIFAVLIFFSIAVFTRSFLRLREYSPVLDRVMQLFTWYYFLLFFVFAVIGYRAASLATAAMGIVLILAVFTTAIIIYSRGYKPARYFLLAWTFFLLGMVLLLLKLMGVLPPVFLTEHSVHIGFLLNSILLSFALSDKINLLRIEKEEVQKESLKHLEESERLKSKFLQETEKLVEERTRDLENANAKLSELASVDVLTGLANRRVFNEIMDREFKRAKRQGTVISFILIDIDYFKNFNDRYGHLDGDACLAELSGIFRTCVSRATDTVARYGGEEFGIILCDTEMEGALKIAEEIRKDVEDANIPHSESPYGCVTVSCGVTSCTPMIQDRLEDFINKADKALYRAKAAGKNCVEKNVR